jgi:hypothetical protein
LENNDLRQAAPVASWQPAIHHHWIPQGPVEPSVPWQTLQSGPTVPQRPSAVAVLQNFTWQKKDEEACAGLASMWRAAMPSARTANLQSNFLEFIFEAPLQLSIV